MSASRSLPARPSLESLRKQAKKLARDAAAGDAGAIARAQAHMPNVRLPLTQRSAQLVIAREYGYVGWQELTGEVVKRLGDGLEWAASRARRIIHDNDIDALRALLAEYPALLSWRGDNGRGVLGMATGAYGDVFEAQRERDFTRKECAELVIDAGAVVTPAVCDDLIESRARGLLQLFQRRHLLPPTLKFHAALGDLDAVRTALSTNAYDLAAINEAFVCACRLEHRDVGSLLLERSIALDPELGRHIDRSSDRATFITFFLGRGSLELAQTIAVGPWRAFVMSRVVKAIHDDDLATFDRELTRAPELFGEAFVWFQVRLVEVATLNDRGKIIAALLDLRPALLRRQPPPPSQAIEFALTYRKTHLIPLLTRIWPLPDDLPHAAGMGDLDRVKRWFDTSGAPALGDLENHYPSKNLRSRHDLHWSVPSEQHVLDVALAYAVINHHFAIADFLLEHGADINTDWNSHEPASILHGLVFEDDYEAMQFLIDRGIDMTIKDYRWNSTAYGWALYGKSDERMAKWLADAERQRAQASP